MRRILSVALALALLCMGVPAQSALAEGEPAIVSLSVGTVDGAKGDTVELPVAIDNCAGVDSAQFHLNYDAAALKIVTVTPGTVFPAEYCVTNTNEDGRVRVAAIDAMGLTGGGDMLLLSCRLLTDGGSAVTISDALVTTVDADYTQSKAYVSVTDGGVRAGGNLPAPVAATPWIPETPLPTPSPTPEPTEQPSLMTVTDTTSAETPPPETIPEPEAQPNLLPYIIAGVLSVLIAAGIIIILISNANTRKRRKKRRRKRKKTTRPVE